MKITCPTCSAKYSIADDKVENRLAKIRCRKCGATIVIDGKVSPVRVYVAEGDVAGANVPLADTGGDGSTYSVDLGRGDPRNMSVAEIVAAFGTGQITLDTFVWADGFADWKPVKNVPELATAVRKPAGGSRGGSGAAKTPWDESGSRGAARTASGAGGRDLFGGIATAGSEEEVTTSAPEEAPVPLTVSGARNESSVLFSLAALTASSPSNPPPAAAAKTTKEDSGLIDLKALAAAGDQHQAAPALAMPSPLGLAAPLGLAPPLGGGVESSIAIPELPPKKNRAGVFVAVAVVCAGAAVAITVAATGSREPAAPPTPSVVYIEKPTPPRPTEEAKPPPTGDQETKDAGPPSRSRGGGRLSRRGGSRATGGESTPQTGGGSESPAPAAKKSSGGCACAPGDLACAIRCRAGK